MEDLFTILSSSYNYTGSGEVTLAGSSISKPNLLFRTGRSILSIILILGNSNGVFGKVATGSGGITLGGNALFKVPVRKYNSIGSVYVRGFYESNIIFNNYQYTSSTGSATIAGLAEIELVYFSKKCKDKFVCNVQTTGIVGKYNDCFEPQFIYTDCGKNRIKCNPNTGAFLPAVTICRQRFFIPPLLNQTDKKRKTWATRES